MNLLHLEQFYEVAKAGSVSTGARKLRISQPAISKSIRLLEEALGAKLFERSSRGMRLTNAGQLAFEHAGKIFSEARSLSDKIEGQKASLSGEWCLGASDTLSLYLLPPLLTEMKAKHPALNIQLFSGPSTDIKEELLGDRCDAGLFFTPPATTEALRFEEIGKTEFWIVLAKNSVWAKKKKNWSLDELRRGEIPRIQSRQRDYVGKFPASFYSNKLGLTGKAHLEANLHEMIKRLVMGGAGYAILIRGTVEAEVRSGELLRISTPQPLPAPIYWVTRKGRASHPASEEFLKQVTAKLKNTGKPRAK